MQLLNSIKRTVMDCTLMLWLLCCRGCTLVTTTVLVAEGSNNNWATFRISICTLAHFLHLLVSHNGSQAVFNVLWAFWVL